MERNVVVFGFIAVIWAAIITVCFTRQREGKKGETARPVEQAKKKVTQENSEEIINTELHETRERYFLFVRKEHGHTHLVGFVSHANIDVSLLDVFVSLRFSESWRETPGKHPLPSAEGFAARTVTPLQVLENAVRKKRALLLLGGPWSGKTTLRTIIPLLLGISWKSGFMIPGSWYYWTGWMK